MSETDIYYATVAMLRVVQLASRHLRFALIRSDGLLEELPDRALETQDEHTTRKRQKVSCEDCRFLPAEVQGVP